MVITTVLCITGLIKFQCKQRNILYYDLHQMLRKREIKLALFNAWGNFLYWELHMHYFNLKIYEWSTKRVYKFYHPTYKSKNTLNEIWKHKTCSQNT